MTITPGGRPWRIAQVAPLHESVPPRLYGGTERVVSYLTEELVRAGHEVTLFASGDSVTSAQLVSVTERALRLDERRPDPVALHVLLVEEVFKRADAFDVIHFHIDSLHLPLLRRQRTPGITTLHGRLDVFGLEALFGEYAEAPLVSISAAQRRPLPNANWVATVHHGLPLELHAASSAPGRYLAFLGRTSREKRLDRAIAIARRTGIPLKIAAKIDRADLDFYRTELEPLIEPPLIEYVGEIGDHEKGEFLGGALALLCPIDWPEPFGLAMVEAMACGTPVIAFRGGSVDELIDEGETGYVVESVDAAVGRVFDAERLDRRRCRQVFERRFSAARMTGDYCNVYSLLVNGSERRTG